MTPLIQQLEDKKKEKEKMEEYYIYPYHMEQDKEALEKYNKLCFEIAILEQAIAEMQKQRQEEIEFLQWIYSNNGVEEDFDNAMISIDNRINRLKEQQLTNSEGDKK